VRGTNASPGYDKIRDVFGGQQTLPRNPVPGAGGGLLKLGACTVRLMDIDWIGALDDTRFGTRAIPNVDFRKREPAHDSA
jgi:hypothetical protein